MKKSVLPHLTVILLLMMTTPVHASVELKATIDQDVHVIFDLRAANTTFYERIIGENLINETKIPTIIKENLKKRNLTNVEYRWEPMQFNDAENSITVRFYLSGSDIINSTFSTESMKRIYQVRTDWRKFKLNLTHDFSLDFTQYFGKPMSDWNLDKNTNPTYYHNYTGTIALDPICYFILPKEATNVHVEKEIIVFEVPLSSGESLLNSPFSVLGAIIVAIIVASLYRRVGKSEEHEPES